MFKKLLWGHLSAIIEEGYKEAGDGLLTGAYSGMRRGMALSRIGLDQVLQKCLTVTVEGPWNIGETGCHFLIPGGAQD